MTESKEMYEFRKTVKDLKTHRGRGTELISVYVTPGYPISDISGKLRDEYSQASNIKSKSTQKNVQAALEKIMAFLKTFKKTPEMGMAIFSGNISKQEGQVDVQLFSVLPPVPLTTQFYRCESTFVTEPLEELIEQTGTYGLVVMDGKDATIALLKGKNIKVLRSLHSTAMQKQHHGGQSAARFQRIHEETVEKYYQRIGEAMDVFLEQKNFQGVIVGGPGPSKENFLKLKTYNYQLKVLGVVDTGYAEEHGLKELMEKSQEILAEQDAIKEKKLLTDFIQRVVSEGLATYGLESVHEAVLARKASIVIATEDLTMLQVKMKCDNCGREENKTIFEDVSSQPCVCGQHMKVVEKRDLLREVLDEAEKQNIPIEFVSDQTPEGSQFKATFKGIGALLRYR